MDMKIKHYRIHYHEEFKLANGRVAKLYNRGAQEGVSEEDAVEKFKSRMERLGHKRDQIIIDRIDQAERAV